MGMLHLTDVYQPKQTLTFDVQLPTARYNTPQKRPVVCRQPGPAAGASRRAERRGYAGAAL